MHHELDRMLERLHRRERLPVALESIEEGLWARIEAREARRLSPGRRLSWQLAAVAAAFVLGVVIGLKVPGTAETRRAFLVEEMVSLAPDSSSLLL